MHACNSSTQEVESEDSGIQGLSKPHRKLPSAFYEGLLWLQDILSQNKNVLVFIKALMCYNLHSSQLTYFIETQLQDF